MKIKEEKERKMRLNRLQKLEIKHFQGNSPNKLRDHHPNLSSSPRRKDTISQISSARDEKRVHKSVTSTYLP